MKKNYITLLVLFCLGTIHAQKTLEVSLDEATRVTVENVGGLYFAGERNTNFRFAQRITPHGDCIDVVNGYAFLTWYKGGVENRNLMLSRKNLNIANSPWVTIEFPHKHVGIRGEFVRGVTPARGDSHNTAAIGVSTIDGTVHMIYDMHSYNKSLLPTSFFNYTVSKKNVAFLPDNEFTIDKFLPKQNKLNDSEDYERMTYPFIMRAPDGSLIARYRNGGSGNGDILFSHYDGNTWSNHWTYHEGTLPEPNTQSLYGGERFINGKFYSGFSIRFDTFRDYTNNNGFYFATTDDAVPSPESQWFNINNQRFDLPFTNPQDDVASGVSIKIGEPSDDYGTNNLPTTSSDPAWTVTKNGAIHFITRVDGRNVHYYKAASDTEFSSNNAGLIPNPQVRGKMLSYKGNVFMVELLGGRVNVKTTPEGVDAWKIVYRGEEETLYQHFNALVVDNKLHVYLMERGSNVAGVGDSRPLYFQTLSLTEVDDENPAIVRTPDVIEQKEEPEEVVRDIVFSVEAEDYDKNGADISYFDKTLVNTGGSNYRNDESVDIQAISTASNGHVVAIFEGEEWVKYTFEIEEAGEYDFILTAANRNRDDSTMDVEINGQVTRNLPIKRSFDWNVFEENIIENITLNKGTNTVVVTQRKSQSSTLDKIEFARKSTLSTNDFSKQNITIYPNPSTGIFNVISNGQNLKYALINLQGQLLEKGVVNQNKIDISRFNSGVYFLELILEDKKLIKKIILK